MEFKTISIVVPREAEEFNDIFTPEDNYEMIKIGRQTILNNKKSTPPHINERDKITTDRVRAMERQIEWMRVELLKYGILCNSHQFDNDRPSINENAHGHRCHSHVQYAQQSVRIE